MISAGGSAALNAVFTNTAVENVAVCFQGVHTGADIRFNETEAAGDHGLSVEYGYATNNFTIDNNIFSGQTFIGSVSGGWGFSGNNGETWRFSEPNTPRQLVVIGGGSFASNTVFTSNQINGTVGGINGSSSAGLTPTNGHIFINNIGSTSGAVVADNTFDKAVYVDGSSNITIGHNLAAAVAAIEGAVSPTAATLNVLGTHTGNVNATTGTGSVTITPVGMSTATSTGSVTLASNDKLKFAIDGLTSNKLVVTGNLALGNATLELSLINPPTLGATYTLVDAATISGTFSQGSVVSTGGYTFAISYAGGDVVLTSVLTPGSVLGTSGDDTFTFNYQGANTAVIVNGVPYGTIPSGTISVNGLGGTNTIIVNGTSGADEMFVSPTSIGAETLDVQFTLIQSLVLNGLAGNDTFTIHAGTAFGATLNGGDDDDVFIFMNTGAITGSINGGNGANTLDYAAYTTGVNVVLANAPATGTATGASGISAIRHVIGGEGADTFVGNTQNNRFTGNGGNDHITGGGGADTLVETGDVSFVLTDTSLTGLGNDTLVGFTHAFLTGGGGANTFDVSGWTKNVTINGMGGADTVSATRNANFELTDSSLKNTNGLNATLIGIGNAILTGGANPNTFNVSGWNGTGAINGAAGNDTLVSSRDDDATISMTSFVSGGANLTLSLIEVAHLTGGAGNNHFDVSGWTKTGSINGLGGTDTVFATKNKNFTLIDSQLKANDGLVMSLTEVENANLTGGAAPNSFTVTGWTGGGTIDGVDGNDTVIANKDTDYTLSDLHLGTSDGMSLGMVSIEMAKLTGGVSANTFNLDGWTSPLNSKLVGGGGADILEVTRDADFTLTNTKLTVKSGPTIVASVTFSQIGIANLTGGASANSFTVSAWTGTGELDGQGDADTVVKVSNTDLFTLQNDGLVTSDGMNLVLTSIDIAKLTGGAASNSFDISGWSKSGTFAGGGGVDSLLVAKDSDITISQTSVFATDGLSASLSSFESATIKGGDGDNRIDASAYSGLATLYGYGGNDILLGGNGVNTLYGGAGRDLLIGGNGADTLEGEEDDDILIGARTIFGNNFLSLDKIMAEWTSANTYADRINNIKTGGGLTLGTSLTKASILEDSGASDSLYGGLGEDWFFRKNTSDSVFDLEGDELIEGY